MMVRPEGVEPPTYWFVASCSIQLSYGRTLQNCSNLLRIPEMGLRIKGFNGPALSLASRAHCLFGDSRRGGGLGQRLVR